MQGGDRLIDVSAQQRSPTPFKSPLAAMAASFALGIAWAHSFHATVGIQWFLAGAGTSILVGLILLRAEWDKTAICMVLLGMTFTGVAAARRWEHRFPLNHIRNLESLGANVTDPVRLTGRVISTPYRAGYGMQFDVEAQRIESGGHVYPVIGKIRLRLQELDDRVDPVGNSHEIAFGDVIQTSTRLRPPHVYQNPGSFDFREWMEDIEDLYWVGTVKSARQVVKIGHAKGFLFDETVEHARQRLLRGIDDIYPPWSPEGRNGAVLKAVLWGDRTGLDSTTIDDFRKTGLYHLLVIAGLHIGLITLLVEFLLRWLGFRRVTRALMVLGFLAVYALLVEQRAPTLRATLMIGLYLAARIVDRGHSPLNSLGGVALILLYYRPAWLFESGFQLSFSAALLIVGVAVPVLERTTEPYRRALLRIDDVLLDDYYSPNIAQTRLDLRARITALRRRSRTFERFPGLARNVIVAPLRLIVWTVNIVIFSAILQLGLMLPMVEIFHRVTFAGVGLNAAAIPMMTVLLALALPINLLSVASPALAAWPAKVLSLVMALLFDMTHLPEMAAWLSYRMPAPPVWVAWGFCAAFVLAGCALRFSRRWVGVAFVACAIFVSLVAVDPFPPRLPQGAMEVTALDCGQGEAVFLVLPGGATMLVNAGGGPAWGTHRDGAQGRRWNAGEEIVSPYLWWRGIKRIDVVALTLTSPDNFEGLKAILENFEVGEVWRSPTAETPDDSILLQDMARRRIPMRTLAARDRFSLSGASFHVFSPNADGGSSGSMAIEISADGMDFVLGRDGGSETDNGIVIGAPSVEPQAHGVAYRRSSSSVNQGFPALAIPRVEILTSGGLIEGRDGAMNAEPSARTQTDGARIFHTATDGATTVEWKNGSLVVRTYRNPEGIVITSETRGPVPSRDTRNGR